MFKTPNQLFGDLEADIMEILWQKKHASVRQVLNKLLKQRKVAYTTVMTVMSRLCEKGILKRKLQLNGAYVYRPVQPREDFLAAASEKIIKGLISDYGHLAVAQFIDLLESTDSRNLAKWRRQLKKFIKQ